MVKNVYEFELEKEVLTDQIEKTVNENGEEVSVTRKIKQKIPVKFGFRRPTKNQKDDLDLEHKVFYSQAIQKGVLPMAILQRQISDSNGVFSKKDQERQAAIIVDYADKQKAFVATPEEDKETKSKLLTELQDLMIEFDEISRKELSIYNQSAEGYARTKINSILLIDNSWNLTDNTPVFNGKTREEKLEKVEEIDQGSDEFDRQVLKIFLYVSNAYMNNDRISKEDLDKSVRLILGES